MKVKYFKTKEEAELFIRDNCIEILIDINVSGENLYYLQKSYAFNQDQDHEDDQILLDTEEWKARWQIKEE